MDHRKREPTFVPGQAQGERGVQLPTFSALPTTFAEDVRPLLVATILIWLS